VTGQDFAALVSRLGAAATAGDGKAFAACFTDDGVYHDYIYGPHTGRAAIADMLENLFHRDAGDYDWRFFDPVTDGRVGYARSLSRFVSRIPEFAGRRVIIDGTSRFLLKDGLIEEYRESVNAGVAMVQLGVAAPRMEKVFKRWSERFLNEPEVGEYTKGSRSI
jgi:hypothetical protein